MAKFSLELIAALNTLFTTGGSAQHQGLGDLINAAAADGNQVLVQAGAPAALSNDGDIYINTTTGDLYKQASGAWGSPLINIMGGGGGGTPVVTSDPVSPALNQQWILRTPFSSVPGIGGSSAQANPLPGFAGNIVVSVQTSTPSDTLNFAESPANSSPWAFTIDNQTPGASFTITSAAPNGHSDGLIVVIGTDKTKTVGQFITAVNAWATTNLSGGVSPIISLTSPSDGSILWSTIPSIQLTLNLLALGTPESYVYKVQGTSKVFSTTLT